MPGQPRKKLNGFEYYSENNWGHWSWFFKPIGGPFYTSGEGPKAKFLAFLGKPEDAMAAYQRKLRTAVDVEAAVRELSRAKAFHASVNNPDWDPGGTTNNPGKVARALRDAAASGESLAAAERAVATAQEWRTQLTKEPFDIASWKASWLPANNPKDSS